MSFFLAVISNKVDISAVSSLGHFPNSCPKYPTLTGQHSGLMDGSSLIQLVKWGGKEGQGSRSREGILSEGGTATLKGCLSLQ